MTAKSTEWKRGRKDAATVPPKSRKRKPRREAAAKAETPTEQQRRLLTEQMRRAQSVSQRLVADRTYLMRQEDVAGIVAGNLIHPPKRLDKDGKTLVVDARAVNAINRTAKTLSDLIERMRDERGETPDVLRIVVQRDPGPEDEPDRPVYLDDVDEALERAREADARSGHSAEAEAAE